MHPSPVHFTRIKEDFFGINSVKLEKIVERGRLITGLTIKRNAF